MYDILIVGSGFAGSITALCLNSAGFDVCLVEKESHPRFAIGESSTPVADMILRQLADTYGLPELGKLSRYGTWQKHYPDVPCGLKRGFSYYYHSKNQLFTSDNNHSKELLVAASVDNKRSDTQWYRPGTDHLLVQMVLDSGVHYLDHTNIDFLEKRKNGWSVKARQNDKKLEFTASFLIDSTGSQSFSNRFLGTSSSNRSFKTNTKAIYSHFRNVSEWYEELTKHGFYTDDYPYNPDHSALHHIIDPGWLWMLRFNHGITSAGLVIDQNSHAGFMRDMKSPAETWRSVLSEYPSLYALFRNAATVQPPGMMISTNRLQRRLDRMTGTGWAALHHTAGFVDPLHSTGIAHSLAGVEKLTQILVNNWEDSSLIRLGLETYQEEFNQELDLIDLLVAGCYQSRHYFDLFTAFSMLYFTCTIHYEQKRLSEENHGLFLSAGQDHLTSLVENHFKNLGKLINRGNIVEERKTFIRDIRESIRPYNIAGLMEPDKKNMYKHTAADF